MNATEVLEAIPKHLDEFGWCQGLDHDSEGAACLRGAISDLSLDRATVAEVNLRLHLTVGRDRVMWNDQTGRTIEEVKEACVTAAHIPLILSGANLFNANLTGANLSNANLCDAELSGACLKNANLKDAYLSRLRHRLNTTNG